MISWASKFKLRVSDGRANIDILPTASDRRTWTWLSFFCYWFSESWAVSTWSLGSSMVASGLTVAESIILIFFSNATISMACVLNSRAASVYHVGYPVLSRATFGVYAHYFFVVLRAILGIIWGGVQLYFEGVFISIILRSIFPGWWRLHNTIPASQYIDLQTFLGFFFAFLLTLPFLFIHTRKLKHLFTIKSVILPFTGLGLVIWAAKENHGINSSVLTDTSIRQDRTTFCFQVFYLMNSVFGASSALVVTIPDLARYSTSHRGQLIGQMLGLPIAQTICATFGILTTAAMQEHWGELYWNPYDLLNGILDHSYTPKARAGVFFAAFSFAFATFGTSVACNIIPFAADVTSLFPKYMNIVRGQILCLLIAFAIVPWRILTSATRFLNFLGGYSIFQGCVVSIMAVDYFLIRNGNLDVVGLYNFRKDGIYFYTHGVNLRGIFAFVAGFLLPFPGFCAVVGSFSISTGAQRLYNLGWLLSFFVGGLSYYLACLVFPIKPPSAKEFEINRAGLDETIAEMFAQENIVVVQEYASDKEDELA